MFALLFKIIPAIIVFILAMGMIDPKNLKKHPFLLAYIS